MNCSRTSILVITGDRDAHLINQYRALENQDGYAQLVVGFMDQSTQPWQVTPEHLSVIHIDSAGGLRRDHPNLSAARNAVATHAIELANRDHVDSREHTLLFLDVDCIPGNNAVELLTHQCEPGLIVMADPHYLPPGWDDGGIPDDLDSVAMPHPSRANLLPGASDAWDMFWSLGFAITASDFTALGGFDEAFDGFGGEDTDFGYRARDAGMNLWLSEARVFHQPHPVYRPPLQHLEGIVANARRFKDRWGTWPMAHWLHQFEQRGYVQWSENHLEVLRVPTGAEVAQARAERAAFS